MRRAGNKFYESRGGFIIIAAFVFALHRWADEASEPFHRPQVAAVRRKDGPLAVAATALPPRLRAVEPVLDCLLRLQRVLLETGVLPLADLLGVKADNCRRESAASRKGQTLSEVARKLKERRSS